ncbi:MAG: KR domain-containing protein, partial [Demequinaceae bacterium]|nr:KR domain-containing protein [Demequinaceae bacterium]
GFGMDAGMAGMWAAVDASIAKGELFTDSGHLEALIGRPATPLATVVAAAVA